MRQVRRARRTSPTPKENCFTVAPSRTVEILRRHPRTSRHAVAANHHIADLRDQCLPGCGSMCPCACFWSCSPVSAACRRRQPSRYPRRRQRPASPSPAGSFRGAYLPLARSGIASACSWSTGAFTPFAAITIAATNKTPSISSITAPPDFIRKHECPNTSRQQQHQPHHVGVCGSRSSCVSACRGHRGCPPPPIHRRTEQRASERNAYYHFHVAHTSDARSGIPTQRNVRPAGGGSKHTTMPPACQARRRAGQPSRSCAPGQAGQPGQSCRRRRPSPVPQAARCGQIAAAFCPPRQFRGDDGDDYTSPAISTSRWAPFISCSCQ